MTEVKKKHAGGRPKDPALPAKLERVLELVSQGESVSQACRNIGMSKETVYDNVLKDAEFANRYSRARAACIDVQVDAMEEMMASEPDANWARVKMDALKWKAGKLSHKKYGDKLELSGDSENPVKLSIEWSIVEPKG